MILTTEIKKQIDDRSYASLLQHWRFAMLGDPIFEGETGEYYKKVMEEKKSKLSHDEQVNISKMIGWK